MNTVMVIFFLFTVTQKNCACALYNMADDNENCAIMLDAGALLHVVKCTQAKLSSTKVNKYFHIYVIYMYIYICIHLFIFIYV
jgi:hypothetical protein